MGVLEDCVALVTGGSRGIGKAISLALAEAGAAVAVKYRERVKDANVVFFGLHDPARTSKVTEPHPARWNEALTHNETEPRHD